MMQRKLLWMMPLWCYWILKTCWLVLLIPPWQNPDEPTHFAYAAVLSTRYGTDTSLFNSELETRILVSMRDHHFWTYMNQDVPSPYPTNFASAPILGSVPTQTSKPPLFYHLSSRTARVGSGDPAESLIATRLFSFTLCGIGMAVIAVGLAAIIQHPVAAFLSYAWLTFLPQLGIAASAANPDSLLFLLAAIFFLLVIPHHCIPPSRWRIMVAILILPAAILTRLSGGFLVIAALLWLPIRWADIPIRRRISLRCILPWIPVIALVTLITAVQIHPLLWRRAILEIVNQLRLLTQSVHSPEPVITRIPAAFFPALTQSFVFTAGWMRITAPHWLYIAWFCPFMTALLASLFSIVKPSPSRLRRVLFLCFLSVSLLVSGTIVIYGFRHMIPQGRYLFPILLPLALLIANGWQVLLTRCRWLPAFLLPLLLAIDVYTLFACLLPAFYPGP